MTSNQLKLFKVSAEEENLHKAAEKTYVSVQALSKNIQNLEQELGVPLFSRSRNKLILNKYGEKLLKYATEICGMLDEAEEYFHNLRKPVGLSFLLYNITHIYTLSNNYQQPSFGSFEINIYNRKIHGPMWMCLQNDFADVIIAYDDMVPDECARIGKYYLGNELYYLAVQQEHPNMRATTMTLREMSDKIICYSQAEHTWLEEFQEHFQIRFENKPTIPYALVSGNIRSSFLMGILDFMSSGIGKYATDTLQIELIEDALPRPVFLYYKKDREKDVLPLIANVERRKKIFLEENP